MPIYHCVEFNPPPVFSHFTHFFMKKVSFFVACMVLIATMTAQTIPVNYSQEHAPSIVFASDTIVAHNSGQIFTITPTEVLMEGKYTGRRKVKLSEPSPGIVLAADKSGPFLVLNLDRGQTTMFTPCGDYIVFQPAGGYVSK